MSKVDKIAIMDAVLGKIKEEMPDERVGLYKDLKEKMDVSTLTTGSIAVDEALNGGFAIGRINSIVGKASSGKTTMALSTIAELQKAKRKEGDKAMILYVDAENALDPRYMRKLGVDLDELYIVQPDNGENGYRIADLFIKSGVADLVILDSIPALIPQAMFDYELDEQPKIALGATLDTRGMSRLVSSTKEHGGTVIAINQYKEKITIGMPTQGDGFSGNGYLPGGTSLPFMFSQVLKIQRVGKISEGDKFVGDQIRVWTIKNKIGAPYTEADYFTTYGGGIRIAEEIIEYGVQEGLELVGKTARTYWLVDQEATAAAREENPDADQIAVEGSRQSSRIKFLEYLEEDEERLDALADQIRAFIRQKIENSEPSMEAIEEGQKQGVVDGKD